jgi:hypothetical protein
VYVAGAKRTALQVVDVVEHEQQTAGGAAEVSVADGPPARRRSPLTLGPCQVRW